MNETITNQTGKSREEIAALLEQTIFADGAALLVVEKDGRTRVGVRIDNVTSNITAAVCLVYNLPHIEQSIQASAEEVLKRLSSIQAKKHAFSQRKPARKEDNKDLIAALKGLGYSTNEAKSAIECFPDDTPPDFETRLRLALHYLAR